MPHRRVVITGMGLVTPLGTHPDSIFERLYAGESAVRNVDYGQGALRLELPVAEAEWDPGQEAPALPRPLTDPVAHMAVAATRRALAQAGLLEDEDVLARAGVYMGCSFGGARSNEEACAAYFAAADGKPHRRRPGAVPRIMASAPAAHVSMGFGIRGPSCSYSVACASSATAIGEAFRAIRDGYLDCVVAGGAEAMLTGAVLYSWEALSVLAKPHADGPGASVRPFDSARTGFAIGEGAGVVVLEAEPHARARGAGTLGEIVGYGAASDAHNLTEPSREGQARAMTAALGDAGIEAAAVGYVNAHATGTRVGDVVEIQAIKEALGAHSGRVAVSSTKSMHGHLVGAAGAVELGITLVGLGTGRIPPTANLTDPDPECDLDCVPLRGRAAPDLEYAMSNSFAFGGSNVSLIAKRAGP